MTNITPANGGGEVQPLQTARAKDPAGPETRTLQAVNDTIVSEARPAPEPLKSLALSSDQDPLEQAARAIEELVTQTGQETKLRINRDEETGRFVYQSIDPVSGEVVGQFPPETILEIISHFRDPEGLIVDGEA